MTVRGEKIGRCILDRSAAVSLIASAVTKCQWAGSGVLKNPSLEEIQFITDHSFSHSAEEANIVGCVVDHEQDSGQQLIGHQQVVQLFTTPAGGALPARSGSGEMSKSKQRAQPRSVTWNGKKLSNRSTPASTQASTSSGRPTPCSSLSLFGHGSDELAPQGLVHGACLKPIQAESSHWPLGRLPGRAHPLFQDVSSLHYAKHLHSLQLLAMTDRLRLLSEVGDYAKVCVQQTSRDLQGVLPRPAEPLQDAQPTFPLNHPGQLHLNPAASHTRSCSRDEPLKCPHY
ncbi:hypothetical protein INR49_014473 [Caranx melampygus]|nr:hypothetical protein INR49_014473 [Caranx melampygus]